MSASLLAALVIAHFIGDYGLQSDWMATEKVKRWWPAIAHGLAYGLPFLLIEMSWVAWLVIIGTHIVIDRYRLARHLVWIKNFLAPRSAWPPPFRQCQPTGYPPDRPVWLTTWLMIILDNTLHISINFLAVRYL